MNGKFVTAEIKKRVPMFSKFTMLKIRLIWKLNDLVYQISDNIVILLLL